MIGKPLLRSTRGLLFVLLVGVGLFLLFPFFWMVITSLKESGDVFSPTPKWIPWLHFQPTLRAFRIAWSEVSFARYTMNSFIVASAVTVGQVFTSSLAAFAFARLRFPGRDRIFLGYLGTMMVPATVTMIPVYILLRELHWIDTYQALIVPGMFSAYGTFLLRQFFVSIPRELEEAARVDGCSFFGIYRRIILPLSLPALSTLSIFTFIGTWRSFMWPLIVTNSEERFTLPVGLAAFRTLHYTVDWPVLMAGSTLMTLPMIVVFLIGQRYFIEGIRLGGVKG